ncbi:MAG: dihydrodipicolinate synthase family protein [Hamadaea sp.]|nr:dihydrodipicolinate synthase family protein [Hamadaea sp.]
MIHPRAAALRDRLRWQLVAATATPTGPDGFDPDVFAHYLRGLVADGVGALAVLAHTGRGPFQTAEVRDQVITIARGTGVPVIVGVGGSAGETLDAVVRQAQRAAELGADGLLVFPAGTDALAWHDALWQASGLPLLAFDLYVRPYPPAVLTELLAHPGVAGLKVARLHDAVACQAAIGAANDADRLAITGEDRMFGPSLLWGAQSALVGLAAAAVPVTARVLRAYADKEYADFVTASAALDRFAAVAFDEPVEGYVQRMLWTAAAEGRIPAGFAADPQAPPLPDGEHDRVLGALHMEAQHAV